MVYIKNITPKYLYIFISLPSILFVVLNITILIRIERYTDFIDVVVFNFTFMVVSYLLLYFYTNKPDFNSKKLLNKAKILGMINTPLFILTVFNMFQVLTSIIIS